MNSVYIIYNSKNCLPKSTNAEKKKKKDRKRELINMYAEPKHTHHGKRLGLEVAQWGMECSIGWALKYIYYKTIVLYYFLRT